MNDGIRYYAVEEIQATAWILQGTVYQKLEDAKFAAMKLFCNTTGVRVKRVADGWTLLFWQRRTVAA